MPTEVIMPQMGFDMTEGTVTRWLKSEGDTIERGEPIVEVETDKATVEVEAFASGVLRKIIVQEGSTVPVNQVIGLIGGADEAISEIEAPVAELPQAENPAPEKRQPAGEEREAETVQEEKKAKAGGRPLVSPLARRIAEEKSIDLNLVTGTGPKGRITKDDVQSFIAQGDGAQATTAAPATLTTAPAEIEALQLTKMRQTIARRMTQSKQEMPHFYVSASIDMTKAMALREELNEMYEGELRITVNDLIVKAVALALVKHPMFNSYYAEEQIRRNPSINIGIAIALEDGLVAPAILDCGNKGLKGIAIAARDLTNRAREGVLKAEEYTSATIAISNLGMFDVDSFIAIINPMQSASVAVGSVRKQPVVRDDQVVISHMMEATISADHRVTDGAQAAQFLNEIKRFLQSPSSLLV